MSEGPLKREGTLGYTKDQVVSCDFNDDILSFASDAGADIVLKGHFLSYFQA